MRNILILAVMLVLIGCAQSYNDFWNPQSCTKMAQEAKFSINGSWNESESDKLAVRAVHNPTGMAGRLVFSLKKWDYDSNTGKYGKQYITYYFDAESDEQKAIYRQYLAKTGIDENAQWTPEDAAKAVAKPVTKPSDKNTKTVNWMDRDL